MAQDSKFNEQSFQDLGGGMVTRIPPFTLTDRQLLMLKNYRYERNNNPSVRGGLTLLTTDGGGGGGGA